MGHPERLLGLFVVQLILRTVAVPGSFGSWGEGGAGLPVGAGRCAESAAESSFGIFRIRPGRDWAPGAAFAVAGAAVGSFGISPPVSAAGTRPEQAARGRNGHLAGRSRGEFVWQESVPYGSAAAAPDTS